MSLQAAICTLPKTATTSKILSSKLGERKISSSFELPQKFAPPFCYDVHGLCSKNEKNVCNQESIKFKIIHATSHDGSCSVKL